MDTCIFCSIISDELPATKIYEDETVLAFLDINPVNPGHVLVIPKAHYRNTLETTDDDLAHIIAIAKKIGSALQNSLNAEGVNISSSTGAAAGQTVFHTHFHVIPRFADDGHGTWAQGEYVSNVEKEKIAADIKNALH